MKKKDLITRFKIEICDQKGRPTGQIVNVDVRKGANWAHKNGKPSRYLAGLKHNTSADGGIRKFRNSDDLYRVREKEQFLWDWSKPEGQRHIELDHEIIV